jgi:hypothetical protein
MTNNANLTITSDARKETGWIHGIIFNRFFAAKVYDEPSTYGINDGRVSKLAVGKTAIRDRNKAYFDQIDYNYDRGLDFDNLPAGMLDQIVTELEKLPKVFASEDEEDELSKLI